MAKQVVDYAREYLSKGYSFFPCEEGEKRPKLRWKEYQERFPTEEEIERWFLDDPASNIAVVTGRISNLIVVDIDPRHGGESFRPRLGLDQYTATTGGGGWHYWYSYSDALSRNSAGRIPGVDTRGDGGYVIAPPSRTTGRYSFRTGEAPHERAKLDDSIMAQLVGPELRRKDQHTQTFKQIAKGEKQERRAYPGWLGRGTVRLESVSNGSRNNSAASLVGTLLYMGLPSDRIKHIVYLWNSDNKPPLDAAELDTVIRSVTETHKRNSGS